MQYQLGLMSLGQLQPTMLASLSMSMLQAQSMKKDLLEQLSWLLTIQLIAELLALAILGLRLKSYDPLDS
jgi:hypothetical protein